MAETHLEDLLVDITEGGAGGTVARFFQDATAGHGGDSGVDGALSYVEEGWILVRNSEVAQCRGDDTLFNNTRSVNSIPLLCICFIYLVVCPSGLREESV